MSVNPLYAHRDSCLSGEAEISPLFYEKIVSILNISETECEKEVDALVQHVHDCNWEMILPSRTNSLRWASTIDQRDVIDLMLLALKYNRISVHQFLTINSLIAAHHSTHVEPKVSFVLSLPPQMTAEDLESLVTVQESDQEGVQVRFVPRSKDTSDHQNLAYVEKSLTDLDRELMQECAQYYLHPKPLFHADGSPEEAAVTIAATYFGLDEGEISQFIDLMKEETVPPSEKTLFTATVPYSLNRVSPELAAFLRTLEHQLRPHQTQIAKSAFKHTELIVPSSSMYHAVHKIRAEKFGALLDLVYYPHSDKAPTSNPYSTILLARAKFMKARKCPAQIQSTPYQWLASPVCESKGRTVLQLSQLAYATVKEVSDFLNELDACIKEHSLIEKNGALIAIKKETKKNHTPAALRAIANVLFLAKLLKIDSIPQSLTDLLPSRKDNGYELLMSFRATHAERLEGNEYLDRHVLNIALEINSGKSKVVAHTGIKDTFTREYQCRLIDKLLVAVRENLISIDQFVTTTAAISLFEGLVNNQTELRQYYVESDQHFFEKVTTADSAIMTKDEADIADINWHRFPDRCTGVIYVVHRRPFIVSRLIQSNDAYYPQAIPLFQKDGTANPEAWDDLAHYFGLDKAQLQKLYALLLHEEVAESEKVLISMRVVNGLREFSSLILAQSYKVVNVELTGKKTEKKLFRPLRSQIFGDEKRTRLLQPSASIHRLVMQIRNPHPHQAAPIMVPENSDILDEEIFEKLHLKLMRPVQIPYPEKEVIALSQVDGRAVTSDYQIFLHDEWHVFHDTMIHREGHAIRDLILEAVPNISSEIRSELTDGEVLVPIFVYTKKFKFENMSKFVEKLSLSEEELSTLAKAMKDHPDKWHAAVGKTWKDLPTDSKLYKKCCDLQ